MDGATQARMTMSGTKSVKNNPTKPAPVAAVRPLSQWSDEELMAEYQREARRELFAELVRRYQRELYSYLRRYLGDPQWAEDVFQTTFLQVHLKCDQYEANRPFRPWLYTLATHLAIDAQRRSGRHHYVSLDRTLPAASAEKSPTLGEVLQSADRSPAVQAAEHEDAQVVRHAVNALSEPMRQVIQLIYFQGLKYREAAEVLAVPVGTVKSRMHAAIARLTEWLNGDSIAQETRPSGEQSGSQQAESG
ncbi:MAG: DNA-directed RNA polymerase sigma-70 factor [Pirellulaceae bacterium]|nr:MAG: DNA-directed RNA polymerase sigma-70 factor [Pirellulaceae bacterium]